MAEHYIVRNNPIPYFFRIVFLSNNFRDPLLRKFEKDFRFTRPEFSILVCLGLQNGISAIEISDITRQPQNTVSRGVLLLTQKKLIRKVTDKSDKRRNRLYLTKEGTAAHKVLMDYLTEANQKMVDCLSSKEKKQLENILAKMCSEAPSFS